MYVYSYTEIMGSKTIMITEDVYDLLKSLKGPDESFSDGLRRLAESKGSIMDLAGAWSDVPDKEIERIKKN